MRPIYVLLAIVMLAAPVVYGVSLKASAAWPDDTLSLVAQIEPGNPRYSDLVGLTVGTRDIIVLGGSFESNPLHIVEVTDPNNPVDLGEWSGSQGWSHALDVARGPGNVVLVGDEHFGAYAVDLTDPESPVELGHVGSLDRLHNSASDGNVLYWVSNETNLVERVDFSDPANPVVLPSLVAAAPNVHGVDYKNGRLYASAPSGNWPNTGIVTVFDVSVEPPVKLVEIVTGQSTHSVAVDDSGDYMVVSKETDNGEADIWDISDLGDPAVVSHVGGFGEGASSSHDYVWVGNILYSTWASAGFHVFDVSVPGVPTHVGGFDTTLAAGGATYATGAWDSWPFFGDDRIVVSDMQNGLFILSLADIPPTPTPTPSPTATATATATPTATPVPTPVTNDKCVWLDWFTAVYGSDATTAEQESVYGC